VVEFPDSGVSRVPGSLGGGVPGLWCLQGSWVLGLWGSQMLVSPGWWGSWTLVSPEFLGPWVVGFLDSGVSRVPGSLGGGVPGPLRPRVVGTGHLGPLGCQTLGFLDPQVLEYLES